MIAEASVIVLLLYSQLLRTESINLSPILTTLLILWLRRLLILHGRMHWVA